MRRAGRCLLLLFLAGAALAADEADLPPLLHAHAHNDYEHEHPLFDALGHGFASVEADIHLVKGQLLVAHDWWQVKSDRTLQSLYLDPLRARARHYGGRIYPHGDPTFYLLIDTKTEAGPAWAALRKVLEDYSDILTKFDGAKVEPKAVTIVLTGNRPRAQLPNEAVRLAGLDGQMRDLNHPNTNGIFLWMSEDWKHFFKWQGQGACPEAERKRIEEIVAQAHERHMKVRFWDAPQNTNFWAELRRDGVDLLNADDLAGCEKFLRAEGNSSGQ